MKLLLKKIVIIAAINVGIVSSGFAAGMGGKEMRPAVGLLMIRARFQ